MKPEIKAKWVKVTLTEQTTHMVYIDDEDRANTDEGAIEAAEEYVYDERNISAGYFDMSSEVISDPVEIERNYRHADERYGPKP